MSHKVLNTMSEAETRKVVRLHDEQGLSFVVIGQRLGMQAKSIQRAYLRGKATPPAEAAR